MSNTSSQHRLEEILSASVDGETSELELRQLLKALDNASGSENEHDALRAKWKNAHTTGAAMRGEDIRFASIDISSQVSAAIQHESIDANKSKPVTWKEMWGKTGIAAAVALGVLFTFQVAQDGGVPSDQVASNAPVQKVAEQVDPVVPQWFKQAPITTRSASVAGANGSVFETHTDVQLNSDEELQLRLQHILKQHTQDAKTN